MISDPIAFNPVRPLMPDGLLLGGASIEQHTPAFRAELSSLGRRRKR